MERTPSWVLRLLSPRTYTQMLKIMEMIETESNVDSKWKLGVLNASFSNIFISRASQLL